jgi:hypothetical protein
LKRTARSGGKTLKTFWFPNEKSSRRKTAINWLEFCEIGSSPTNHSTRFHRRSAQSAACESWVIKPGSNVVGGQEQAFVSACRNAVGPGIF